MLRLFFSGESLLGVVGVKAPLLSAHYSKYYLRIVLFFALAAVFIAMAWAKYISLHSYYFDMGIFQTWLYGIVHRGEFGRMFLGHAHLAALPYLIVLNLIPAQYDALALLMLQSVALMVPFLFLYKRFNWFVAVVFALYAPLWINNHFEFHFDHLAVPLLLWFYLAATSNRLLGAVVAAILLMTVKEPFALQTMACGLFLIWCGVTTPAWVEIDNRPKFIGLGLLLMFIGVVYFYFVIKYLLPYFTDGSHGEIDSGAFSWMGGSAGQVVSYCFLHPLEILWQIISTPGKLLYLFFIFGSLAFIPLLAPSYLIPAIPLLSISLLSQLPNYYNCHTHYTAGLIIPVIFAFANGLPKAQYLWIRVVHGLKWQRLSLLNREKDIRFVDNCSKFLVQPTVRGLSEEFMPVDKPWGVEYGVNCQQILVGLQGNCSPGTSSRAQRGISCFMEPCSPMEIPRCTRDDGRAVTLQIFNGLVLACVLGSHILFAPSPMSWWFWSDRLWAYNWHAYHLSDRDRWVQQAVLNIIPLDPKVSVTTQNSINMAYLAHRERYREFPGGIETPIAMTDWSNRTVDGFWQFVQTGIMPPTIKHRYYADYVVLDLKRPWFVGDQSCHWYYGKCTDNQVAGNFLNWVAKTRNRYQLVFDKDDFMIFKRA